VLAPLAVVCGLNEPHDPVGVQLQVTPPLAGSLDTGVELRPLAIMPKTKVVKVEDVVG
jgi:hypothetical protein